MEIDITQRCKDAVATYREELLRKAYLAGMDVCESQQDAVNGRIQFQVINPGEAVEFKPPYVLYQTSRRTPEIDAVISQMRPVPQPLPAKP